MSKRSRRRNRRKRINREKKLQISIKKDNTNDDLIVCKNNYYISEKLDFPLFIKNSKYECKKINDDFYSVKDSNGKTVIITLNLFERIFI